MRWIAIAVVMVVGCGGGQGTSATGTSGTGGAAGCGASTECDDADPCTDDSCTVDGVCVHSPISGCAFTGGSAGTSGTGGTGGVAGSGGAPVTCNDGVCQDVLAGQCFTSFKCSDGGLCNGVDLIPGKDDGDACTHDVCNGSGWDHVAYTAAEIDDGDPCTTDSCSAETGVTHTAILGCIAGCISYCAETKIKCAGINAQYADDASCNGVCSYFTPSALLCHTQAAMLSDCKKAGPLSACAGNDCASFCSLAVKVCGNQANPPFVDAAACMTACATYPDTMTVPYNATVTSGNSLACRTYYLTIAAASADMAAEHCPDVGNASPACQ